MKTRLYLDIDGVLNPLALSAPESDWDDFRVFNLDGFEVALSHSMSKELLSIGFDEIVWLTTWRDKAYMVGNALGMPNFRYLSQKDVDSIRISEIKHGDWKGSALIGDLKRNPIDRFVWVDDQLNKADFTKTEKYDRLCIMPDCVKGLSKDEINGIKEFLKN